MSELVIPRPIVQKVDELCTLVEENPLTFSVPVAASFLNMNPESLRCALEQNRCPFGFGWQKDVRGNKGFKIPTPTLFFWYTQLNPFKQPVHEDRI